MRFATTLALISLLTGCRAEVDLGGVGGPTGDMGVTAGGAQDIGYARAVIAEGGVPESNAIVTEGLLSEHDLPVVGAPCDEMLCVRPALGIAPSLATGEIEHWVQIGMSSGMQQPYVRPPMDFVMVIDRSSSMEIDLTETMRGVGGMIDHMGPSDRLGIVTFNQGVQVLHPLGEVEDAAALKAELLSIEARGSWDLMPAMDTGLQMLTDAGDDPTRLRRIGLMTCGYPGVSVGNTDEFSTLVFDAANERIGTSVYGVLLGYDPGLADLLGQSRGGSFHYLESLEKVETVFDDEFDTMVSPLAYDLHFDVMPGAAWQLEKLYGIPGDDGDTVARAGFDVATAFLSKRNGAMFARLTESIGSWDPDDIDTVANVELSYVPESAHGFEGAKTEHETVLTAESDIYYAGIGVRKGVALINQAEQMGRACDQFHAGDVADAVATLDELHAFLDGEAEALDDDALRTEVALVEALADNMQR